MRLKLTLISAVFLLSACQTVQDQSIPLNHAFQQQADQFNVKRPTWRLSDTVYQQKLQGPRDTFEITGTETGWGKSEKSQHWFSDSGFSVNGIEIRDKFLRILFLDLLGMREKRSHGYLLKSESDFAFTVNAKQSDMVQVRCRRLSINDQLETTYQMGGSKTQVREATIRLDSYLGCDLQRGNDHWFLTVDTLRNDTPTIRMQSQGQKMDESFEFEPIKDNSYLVNGEWRTMSFNFQQFSGLQFQRGNQTMGAMSFDGNNPKIWIGRQVQAENKSLVLAMSYSLMMYDWLDNGWRSTH